MQLKAGETIAQIKLHNREDCCQNRLEGIRIRLGEDKAALENAPVIFQDDALTNLSQTAITLGASQLDLGGLWLRLEKSGLYLGLAEIEVLNAAGENIVIPATVAQSSEYNSKTAAANAADGNTRGRYGSNEVSHTANGDHNPWLQVQLLPNEEIAQVHLYNREDCCQYRLVGVNLKLAANPASFANAKVLWQAGAEANATSVTLYRTSSGDFSTNLNHERTTQYIYNSAGLLIHEATDNNVKEYVYFNGQPLALLQSDAVYFYHNDHLGTPVKLTDSQQNTVWLAKKLPFGNTEVITATVENNLRFPGQYYDAETGLHYNWHRYYNPQTGRYITVDPIGLAGGVNVFGYVGQNPLRYIDPMGLKKSVQEFLDSIKDAINKTQGKGKPESCGNALIYLGSEACSGDECFDETSDPAKGACTQCCKVHVQPLSKSRCLAYCNFVCDGI